MKVVFIIGNAAVGKMTVGQELMKITDLRLFHNHMTIEPVIEIFGEYNSNVISSLRDVIFEEYAKTEKYGLIFTYMWAFDYQSDWDYIEHVCDIFRTYQKEVEFIYVELVASKVVRLHRNGTENRLKNKASKRELESSNERLLRDDERYRCVSQDGEMKFEKYMKIDNTNLEPSTVAQMIKQQFNL